MRLILLAAASWLILAGCAQLGADQCNITDWYQIGERDGKFGAQPQYEFYAARCKITPDAARYMEGWRLGYSEKPGRLQ